MRSGRRRGTRAGCRALAIGLALAGAGCAARDAPDAGRADRDRASGVAIVADAPEWVTQGCRAYWRSTPGRDEVLCGVGSAPSGRNPVAARETAVARARSAIARSVSVTIESLVRLEDGDAARDGGDLETIVHQLTSASLPACRVEATWRSETGEIHALVSLRIDRVQESVRSSPALTTAAREALARRAAAAFAASRTAVPDGDPTPP